MIYIGETSRKPQKRRFQHRRGILNNNRLKRRNTFMNNFDLINVRLKREKD